MKTPDRQTLIDLCEQALVPHDRWHNRDSASAQAQVAVCAAYLKAGCDFELDTQMTKDAKGRTYWVIVTFNGFEAVKNELFYIPTKQRLIDAGGDDWY